jgi:hypothetical protein
MELHCKGKVKKQALMKISFSTHLRPISELVLGSDSLAFKGGAKMYHLLRSPFLRYPDMPSGVQRALSVAAICSASQEIQPKRDAKRIVFLNIRGWALHLATESLIAAQLRTMGHSISFLWCSDSIPFCMYGSSNHPLEFHRNCKLCCEGKDVVPGPYFERDELPKSDCISPELRELIEDLGIEKCKSFSWDGVPYGELVYRSVVWFLRRSILVESDAPLYRDAIRSAHATRIGVETMVKARRPDTVVMMNGDFSVERVAGFILKRLGVRYVAQDYTFHERLGVSVNDSLWDQLTFEKSINNSSPIASRRERNQALKLIQDWRRSGGYQGGLFWNEDQLSGSMNYREQLGLDSRPVATVYTNLTFESSVVGKDRIFKDQFEWVRSLVAWFKARSDCQLIIRTHPAESRKDHWRPNESMTDFINCSLSPLPENIHVVGPDTMVSSYGIGMISEAILVYSTTLGLELAERGKCVIVAAHVHYGGRGFTVDPTSQGEYFSELERQLFSPTAPSQESHERLVNYLGWFMFRRLVQFEAVSNIQDEWPKINIRSLRDLGSRKMKGVKKMCRLIADGEIWW